jgi:CRISPR-associated protein Csa3
MNWNKNMPTTHVVFVGPERDFLMGSISLLREVGFSRIVLVTGNDPKFSGEALVQKTTKSLARDLGIFWPVTVVEVNKSSVMDAANQILSIINAERTLGNEVLLNVAGALQPLSMSAYIAASMSRARVVSALPHYNDEGAIIGATEIVEIPVLPIGYPGAEQQLLISRIGDGVESLDSLIYLMFPEIDKNSKRFRSERSRLSHHLSKLETGGFIVKTKYGRNIAIHLTCLGQMFAQVISRGDVPHDD